MRSKRRGFTIIEALLAMVLLAVGILAVAQLFMVAILARQKGTNLAIAEKAIVTQFEQMRRTKFIDLEALEGTFDVKDPANDDRKVGQGNVAMERLGTTPGLMKITITVEIGNVRKSQARLTSQTYVAERL